MKKELEFELEKETKNTYRYEEKTDGQPPVVGNIYLQKWAVESDEPPEEIQITLQT